MHTRTRHHHLHDEEAGPAKQHVHRCTTFRPVLSALVFSFYVNDIIEEVSNSSIGCFIDFNCVNIVWYADDFILLCPSANGLQFLIDKLLLNLPLNSLKLNSNKSKYMIFYCKILEIMILSQI